jgi:hypothetical protein
VDEREQGEAQDQEPRGDESPPDLLAALRELLTAGSTTWSASREALTALRILLLADISLARSAFGRTLALTGVAIAAGASAWLLLMAALILFLSRQLGVPWSLSLLGCALLSAAITWWAVWMSQKYFADTRMRATRRQLARLGIGELAGMGPTAGSAESSESAARRLAESSRDTPIKKTMGVDITPP